MGIVIQNYTIICNYYKKSVIFIGVGEVLRFVFQVLAENNRKKIRKNLLFSAFFVKLMVGKRNTRECITSPSPKRKRRKVDNKDDPARWKVVELKKWLKDNDLPSAGRKAVLVQRVQDKKDGKEVAAPAKKAPTRTSTRKPVKKKVVEPESEDEAITEPSDIEESEDEKVKTTRTSARTSNSNCIAGNNETGKENVKKFMEIIEKCKNYNQAAVAEEFSKFNISENDYLLVIFTYIENELQCIKKIRAETRAIDEWNVRASVETIISNLRLPNTLIAEFFDWQS